jgi:hypothetical protein
MGAHIHSCIANKQQERANRLVESSFEPQTCAWKSCVQSHHTFSTRKEYVTHVRYHISFLLIPPTSTIPIRYCEWQMEGGHVCGESEPADVSDWLAHFAQIHGMNVCSTVTVDYCVICAIWFVPTRLLQQYWLTQTSTRLANFCGDHQAWEDHCLQHFSDLFASFLKREERVSEAEPEGVKFIDGCVEFDNGSGFGGTRPEFHGHLDVGVTLTPMFCPWCVFDEGLDMTVRMKQ